MILKVCQDAINNDINSFTQFVRQLFDNNSNE